MLHATELLSNFAADLRYEDLPEEVVRTTKRFVIDYYAACLAGIKVNAFFNHAIEALLLDMGGKEEADTLLGAQRLPVLNAAFLNAVYAHGADMDDGNRKAMGHVGAHVISAVLTLAQILPVDGKDILTAINVGYEVYNRLAAAVQPGLVHRGFHSTGTAGSIACAAACAKLLGLGREGIYNSMALGAVQASGLILIAESGQCCKPLNPANAARTGILSARLAESGVNNFLYPLESRKGWFHAMSDEVDESMITDGLGKQFTVCDSYMKPYPSCRHTHCGLDAVLELRKSLRADEGIKSVKVYIYPNAIQIAGQILRPQTVDDCKFSIHYALATALAKGHFDLSDLNASSLDAQVDELISRIELIADPSMEDRAAGIRGARVAIETEDGRLLEKRVLIPKGDGANPLSEDELRAKLRACAEGLLDAGQQKLLIEGISSLEQLDRLTGINMFYRR